jgi:beta-phosphoglucomutase-like phosphatase (HAD superfamily)
MARSCHNVSAGSDMIPLATATKPTVVEKRQREEIFTKDFNSSPVNLAERNLVVSPKHDYQPQVKLVDPLRGERLSLRCHIAVFDVDGTLLLSSGQHLHDGPQGQFSRGVRSIVRDLAGVTVDEEKWASIWTEVFKKFAGFPAYRNMRFMNRTVRSMFRINPSTNELKHTCIAAVEDMLKEGVRNKVRFAGDAKILCDALLSQGTEMKLCTCSGKQVLFPFLRDHLPPDVISSGHYNALKLLSGDIYSGADIQKAAGGTGLLKGCVMFGDSFSDVASAKLAGVGAVVIRPEPPDTTDPEGWLKEKFEEFYGLVAKHDKRYAGRVAGVAQVPVFLVADFKQIDVGASLTRDLEVLITGPTSSLAQV